MLTFKLSSINYLEIFVNGKECKNQLVDNMEFE